MNRYLERTQRVVSAMQSAELDALLVSRAPDCGYLFANPNAGQGLVTLEGNYMFSYFVELAEARAEAQNCTVIPCSRERPALNQVAETARAKGVRSLGFAAHTLSQSAFVTLHEALPGVELVPADALLERVRNIKTPEEIAAFRQAARLDDAAFTHLLPFMQVGVSELELAAELEYFLRKQGVNAFSFPTIVVSGPRSAFCHGAPTARRLEAGDLITLDYGAIWEGCPSDITRTVVVGPPDARQQEVYATVLAAQELALAALGPGRTGEAVDAVARAHIAGAGYADHFGHSLGHALGGGTHVGPRVQEPLEPGCIVTIEPGIYIEGWGGVRIEDDVLITPDGCEVLTQAPKEFISVG